jgi:hypothetical protein
VKALDGPEHKYRNKNQQSADDEPWRDSDPEVFFSVFIDNL